MSVSIDAIERQFPIVIQNALKLVHPSWRLPVIEGLLAIHAANPNYLPGLIDGRFLPTAGRLFAAFSIPLDRVKYVLVGEGPYPREESATGFCFMDGAVNDLWSTEPQGGLSKKVNRATSLRNFIKMLLVADGRLDVNHTTGAEMTTIASAAREADSGFIQSLPELQQNMDKHGFLLLNASLVFHADVAPIRDAREWQVFLQVIFTSLNSHQNACGAQSVSLVLWGKVAELLKQIPATHFFPHVVSEHPYNLSFIANETVQNFFSPMHLLSKQS